MYCPIQIIGEIEHCFSIRMPITTILQPIVVKIRKIPVIQMLFNRFLLVNSFHIGHISILVIQEILNKLSLMFSSV
jgi:hypothetical protein